MSADHQSRILTGALGEYTVEALKKSALTAFPNIAKVFERRGGEGHHGSYVKKGGFKKSTWKGSKRRSHKTNEAHVDGEEEANGTE